MLRLCGLGIASTIFALSLVPAQTAAAKGQQPRFTFIGAVEPSQMVVVSNRVTGVISDVLARPGSRVDVGQALFRLDAAVLELAVAQAKAARDEAAAALALAEDVAARQAMLRARGAGAVASARQSKLRADIARAALARTEADLSVANLNLKRTVIRATISGIVTNVIGRVGQFVEAEANTQLAEIVRIDPVRVRYSVPHGSRQLAMRLTGATTVAEMLGRMRLTIIEPSGAEHRQTGRADFESATVDPASGMLTTWGLVANPRGTLLPGLKVKVRSHIAPADG
ncbi:MAG: efflux RND transporter periplasmic adaptor subunit [Hyphomicrobiaceae bacterium]